MTEACPRLHKNRDSTSRFPAFLRGMGVAIATVVSALGTAGMAKRAWAQEPAVDDPAHAAVLSSFEAHERVLRDCSVSFEVAHRRVTGSMPGDGFTPHSLVLTPRLGAIVSAKVPVLPRLRRAILFERLSTRTCSFFSNGGEWQGREFDGRPLEVNISALPMLGMPLEIPLSAVVSAETSMDPSVCPLCRGERKDLRHYDAPLRGLLSAGSGMRVTLEVLMTPYPRPFRYLVYSHLFQAPRDRTVFEVTSDVDLP